MRRLIWSIVLALVVCAAVLAAAVLSLGQGPATVLQALVQRTPGELIRHAQRRLEGHPRLQALALPPLLTLQRHVERPVPPDLPDLGKGQQPHGLAPVRYAESGQPLPVGSGAGDVPSGEVLRSVADIASALHRARPGQRFVIAPGHYHLTQPLDTRVGGTAQAPVVIGAARPGEVLLEVHGGEGFVIAQPYWVFENLRLRGACRYHAECEHAFHVKGAARGIVLRNNHLEDFNAHVKVNGERGLWPDDGLLQFNTLLNTVPRQTGNPVSPVDIVAASGWQVSDNKVANFVKAQGNQISYGVFMKGAGRQGRIERNVIVCTTQGMSQPGSRVGLSFGGGSAGARYCRDGRCLSEHEEGLIANNVVAHCNDFGIDVFRSSGTVVAHNTLVNTAGIDVHSPPAQAVVEANLLDGRIREIDGGLLQDEGNEVGDLAAVLKAPDGLLLEPVPGAARAPVPVRHVTADFCGAKAPLKATPGALLDGPACAAP